MALEVPRESTTTAQVIDLGPRRSRASALAATAVASPSDTITADPVRLYLNEIGRVDLLTSEEEVDLAKRVAAGVAARALLAPVPEPVFAAGASGVHTDSHGGNNGEAGPETAALRRIAADGEAATAAMVEANLRLVVSIARRYGNRGLLFPDLIQEGNLGLIRAVEKFDHTRGYKFSTYATWWIRQTIGRAMADQGRLIRMPVHVVETLQRITKTERALQQSMGREPTLDELAYACDLLPERVEELKRLSVDPSSLDAPLGGEADFSVGDLIEDGDAIVPAEAAAYLLLQRHLAGILANLTQRERDVLERRFGLVDGRAQTLEEIGAALDLTRERIRQIETKALAKLRHPSYTDELVGYLDT